jgi:hypothetical protein
MLTRVVLEVDPMAADYDAPRRTSDDDEPADESLEALRAGGSAHNPTIVEDEANLGGSRTPRG